MSGQALNLIIPVLLALAVASRGFEVDGDYVRDWAASAGVDLDDTTQPIVRRSLLWKRRARTVGGLIGFLTPVVYQSFVGETARDAAGWSFLLMFVGYYLGAWCAEIVLSRRGPGEGAALLVPRRLEDYLPGYVRNLQRSLGLLCVIGAAIYEIEYAAIDGGPFVAPSPLAVAGFGLGGVCIAAITEAIQRSVVHRRQTFSSEDRLAVDDAMRSSSLHVLAAAGIALLFIFAGGQLGVVAAITGSVGGIVGMFVILFTTVAAFSFWRDLSRPHGFRVHRGGHRRVRA